MSNLVDYAPIDSDLLPCPFCGSKAEQYFVVYFVTDPFTGGPAYEVVAGINHVDNICRISRHPSSVIRSGVISRKKYLQWITVTELLSLRQAITLWNTRYG